MLRLLGRLDVVGKFPTLSLDVLMSLLRAFQTANQSEHSGGQPFFCLAGSLFSSIELLFE
jgi:hypothetical protein